MSKAQVQALINSRSEINAIYLTFAKQLGFPIRPTDIVAQKIDGTMLDTYRMVVAAFSVLDKANQVKFFEESFLEANLSPKIVLEMLFLILSDTNVDFLGWKLRWRTYITKETLPTIRRIELVGQKEFAAAVLDPEHETLVVQVASLNSTLLVASLNVYPFRKLQISGLIVREAPTKISAKYLDFADVFSPDLVSKFPKHTGINNDPIEPVDIQQPPYKPIYWLGLMELETLKAYIETNLANSFIRPFKLPAGASILFDRKSNGFFWLCVDYQDLNNLTIKKRYQLPLIEESLDRLRRARRFTHRDLISAYQRIRILKGDK